MVAGGTCDATTSFKTIDLGARTASCRPAPGDPAVVGCGVDLRRAIPRGREGEDRAPHR
jgi:hypothetical protein